MASTSDPGDLMHVRIKKVMDHYGLQQQAFAMKLGVSPATISSIYKGRTKPTNNHVQAIHREFPEINTNWLLFGEGDMILHSVDQPTMASPGSIEQNVVSADKEISSTFPPSGSEIPMFFSEDMVQTAPPVQNAQPVHVAPQRPVQAQPTPQRQAAGRTPELILLTRILLTKSPAELRKSVCFTTTGHLKFSHRPVSNCLVGTFYTDYGFS